MNIANTIKKNTSLSCAAFFAAALLSSVSYAGVDSSESMNNGVNDFAAQTVTAVGELSTIGENIYKVASCSSRNITVDINSPKLVIAPNLS